jgi:hypothetical protein
VAFIGETPFLALSLLEPSLEQKKAGGEAGKLDVNGRIAEEPTRRAYTSVIALERT